MNLAIGLDNLMGIYYVIERDSSWGIG
jgi:hypothetical protein